MANKELPSIGGQSFEDLKQVNDHDAEYWSARALQPVLGYSQWRRFEDAIKRAQTSCEQSGMIPPTILPALAKWSNSDRGASGHQKLDATVNKAYGKTCFKSDAERVAFLFARYQELTSLLPIAQPKPKRGGNKSGAQ